ncbi:MAG: hypothetical protein U1E97_06330 [Alphaproteobacteria bacterium]
MSKLLKAIHANAKGARPDADDILAHARENVWEKDRAAIAQAVKRIIATHRHDDKAGHGKMAAPAGQAG